MRYTDFAPPSPLKVAGTYIIHFTLDDCNVKGNTGIRNLCTPYSDVSCTILKKGVIIVPNNFNRLDFVTEMRYVPLRDK
jgi:hypothetical protein